MITSDHFVLFYNCVQVHIVCDIKCRNHFLYPRFLKPSSGFLLEKDESYIPSIKHNVLWLCYMFRMILSPLVNNHPVKGLKFKKLSSLRNYISISRNISYLFDKDWCGK